jgi:TRAP-type C4-dicarboxylate transport system permease small subunit
VGFALGSALLFGLILLNVASRYGGFPIFWVDEAAIYAVVWLTFIGASAMSRLRLDFAVTMLTGAVGAGVARWLQRVAALSNLLFMLALGAMCAWWLDPAGFAAAGFDAKAFAAQSFNFLYTERTQALGWPTWVFYLVMPLFAACAAVHALANLVEDLGWVPRIERAPLGGHAEA